MLGSPVAEERKRKWRGETWSKGGRGVSLCRNDRRGGGGMVVKEGKRR